MNMEQELELCMLKKSNQYISLILESIFWLVKCTHEGGIEVSHSSFFELIIKELLDPLFLVHILDKKGLGK